MMLKKTSYQIVVLCLSLFFGHSAYSHDDPEGIECATMYDNVDHLKKVFEKNNSLLKIYGNGLSILAKKRNSTKVITYLAEQGFDAEKAMQERAEFGAMYIAVEQECASQNLVLIFNKNYNYQHMIYFDR